MAGVDVDEQVHALDAAEHLLPAVRQGRYVVYGADELTEPGEPRLVLFGDLDDGLDLVGGPLNPSSHAGAPVDNGPVSVISQLLCQLEVVLEVAGGVVPD